MNLRSVFSKAYIGPIVAIALRLALIVSGVACAAGKNDPNWRETKFKLVRESAGYDFKCPEKHLALTEIDDANISVSGCGKDASYTLQECFLGSIGAPGEFSQSECIPVVKTISNRQ